VSTILWTAVYVSLGVVALRLGWLVALELMS
jgi:hypothetical protein